MKKKPEYVSACCRAKLIFKPSCLTDFIKAFSYKVKDIDITTAVTVCSKCGNFCNIVRKVKK